MAIKINQYYLNPIASWRHEFNPLQDSLFGGCSRMVGDGAGVKREPLPKIYYTYLKMMKLGTVIFP